MAGWTQFGELLKEEINRQKTAKNEEDLFSKLMSEGAQTDKYSPLQAKYETVTGPFGIKMKKQVGYQMDPNMLLKGPESYIEKALQQQKLEEAKGLDQAQLAQAQGAAQARANMAMRGGLTPQQRLQIEKQGQRDLMMQRQGVTGKGAEQRANIGLEGDKMGREINRYNIEQQLGQLNKAQELELNKYGTKMAGLAGREAARATRQAAQGQSKK